MCEVCDEGEGIPVMCEVCAGEGEGERSRLGGRLSAGGLGRSVVR